MTFVKFCGAALCCVIVSTATMVQAFAQNNHDHSRVSAKDHAPIGVMGDHRHDKGEWMLSYRYSHMDMAGNRTGTDDIAPETIVTTIANPNPGPAFLRVVPTEMTMDMHMFGLMYAPSDRLTLMAMGHWMEKEMDHITFATAAGSNVRGTFTTRSDGFGDTKLSALAGIYRDDTHDIHLNIGISIPTGSIKETARVLAPNGATPVLRMPYAMQLGTGTYDLHPGLTYNGYHGKWGWGGQVNAEIRLEDENDQGYSWGEKFSATVWAAYEWQPWISTSLRLTGSTQDEIDGADPLITAPVQTAVAGFYGGDVIEAAGGINLIAPRGPLADHRLAFEVTAPLYRDLNGPQLETDWTFMLGWQKAF